MNSVRKMLIAVCGKGGTGKTAVSAMIAKTLTEEYPDARMLLIDADPALGLANALGIRVQHTMGEVRETLIRTSEHGDSKECKQLAESFDYIVFQTLCETERFSFMAMGRTETLGCFCPVNTLLKRGIEKLSQDFDIVVIDGEAGVEQLSRQVVHQADTLLIVTDATERGLQTASIIKKMVDDEKVIQCDRLGVLFNRVHRDEKLLEELAEKRGLAVMGMIPQDNNVADYDLIGRPLIELPANSPAYAAVKEAVMKLMETKKQKVFT